MRRISRGTPGRQATKRILPPRSTGQMTPGAVPVGLGMTVAPSGISACLRLLAGISMPRARKSPSMCASDSSCITIGTPPRAPRTRW
jgi:hypothetical protein